jgi:hypothetical protein
VGRAKDILLGGGICVAAVGVMALPFPRGPRALTQSALEQIATTGVFTRPGVVLMCVGLGCVALSLLMPSGRG